MHMSKEHNPEQHATTGGRSVPEECPSFETLSLYFDEGLDDAAAERVRSHVAGCTSCQAVLDDLRLIRQALRVSTPAASQRSFQLTAEDVRDERPSLQPVEQVESEPARRVTRITIPFLPALTAVAALLLIAIIVGDVFSDDGRQGAVPTPTAEAADVIVINGTPIPVTDEDRAPSQDAAADKPMNTAAEDDPFWDWWRIGEALLLVVLAGLLATIFLQNRSRRDSWRNRA